MKRFLFIFVAFLCIACKSEPLKLEIDKFREIVALPMGTMMYSKIYGIKGVRAYVVLHEMLKTSKKWKETVYWVPVSQLTEAELKKFYEASGE